MSSTDRPVFDQWQKCPSVVTNYFNNSIIDWCVAAGLHIGEDYILISYRKSNSYLNSHRWYFKDPAIRTMFALRWPEESHGES